MKKSFASFLFIFLGLILIGYGVYDVLNASNLVSDGSYENASFYQSFMRNGIVMISVGIINILVTVLMNIKFSEEKTDNVETNKGFKEELAKEDNDLMEAEVPYIEKLPKEDHVFYLGALNIVNGNLVEEEDSIPIDLIYNVVRDKENIHFTYHEESYVIKCLNLEEAEEFADYLNSMI